MRGHLLGHLVNTPDGSGLHLFYDSESGVSHFFGRNCTRKQPRSGEGRSEEYSYWRLEVGDRAVHLCPDNSEKALRWDAAGLLELLAGEDRLHRILRQTAQGLPSPQTDHNYRLGGEDPNLGSRIQNVAICASDETQSFSSFFAPCPVLAGVELSCSADVLLTQFLLGRLQIRLIRPMLADQVPNGVGIKATLWQGCRKSPESRIPLLYSRINGMI
jgi:hypothetical protein